MSPEEARDLIHTLRSQLGQDDHTPERYLLDALFEMANSPPTTPESVRVTLRRCEPIREYDQGVSDHREDQEEVRSLREIDDLNRKQQEAKKEYEEEMERELEAEHARIEADNKELAEMQEGLDKLMEEREEINGKIARLKAAKAEIEEEDVDEGKTKGTEHETEEAEGSATGSSNWEDVGMSEG